MAKKQMTEEELLEILHRYYTQDEKATGVTLLRDFMTKADQYYEGKPRSDDPSDGKSKRSRVVSRDVAEAIESQMPDYIRIFGGSETLASFSPRTADDEEQTQQATDYVNWIYYESNPGFQNTYTHIKSGLMYKIGVMKVWWQESLKPEFEDYTGLSEDEKRSVELNPEIEIIESTQYPDPQGVSLALAQMDQMREAAKNTGTPFEMEFNTLEQPQLWDLRIKRLKLNGEIKVRPIPNEEFFWDGYAQDWSDARWLAHAREITRSELLEMGYSEEQLLEITFGESEDRADYAKSTRFESTTQSTDRINAVDESLQTTEYWEFYLNVDFDCDGIAELRRVCAAGESLSVILNNEPVADHPFVPWTPVPLPFRTIGTCPAEQTLDIQDIKTVTTRNMLDNFYRLNNTRLVIGPGATLADVLNPTPGHPIRANNPQGDVVALSTPNIVSGALEVIQYIDTVKDARTGVNRMAAGLEADALSDTARTAQLQVQSGQQRKELIARVYAETGIKPIFRKILGLITRHINESQVVRLRGRYVTVDPTSWRDNYDVIVDLNISKTERAERLTQLQSLLPFINEVIQLQAGPTGPFIGFDEIYQYGKEVVKATGLKDTDLFFRQPPPGFQLPPPPQGGGSDPLLEQIKAQTQVEMAKLQQKAEFDKQKLQLDKDREIAKLQLELQRLQLEMQKKGIDKSVAEDRALIDAALKGEELRLKYGQPTLDIGGPDVTFTQPGGNIIG